MPHAVRMSARRRPVRGVTATPARRRRCLITQLSSSLQLFGRRCQRSFLGDPHLHHVAAPPRPITTQIPVQQSDAPAQRSGERRVQEHANPTTDASTRANHHESRNTWIRCSISPTGTVLPVASNHGDDVHLHLSLESAIVHVPHDQTPGRSRLSRERPPRKDRGRSDEAADQSAGPFARLLARRRRAVPRDQARSRSRLHVHGEGQSRRRRHERHGGAGTRQHRRDGRQAGHGRQGQPLQAVRRPRRLRSRGRLGESRTTSSSSASSSSRRSAASTSRTSARPTASTSRRRSGRR